MAEFPEDPLRQAPQSFDQWTESFRIHDKEEVYKVSQAAGKMLKSPVFNRVLGEIERNAISALVNCSLKDPEEVMTRKMLVKGVQALRIALKTLASNAEFEDKRSNKG